MITKDNFDKERYRKKLQKRIPDGCYKIGIGPDTMYTGKGGMVEFEIALIESLLNDGMTFENNIYE